MRLSWAVLSMLFTVYFFNSVDRSIFGILAEPIKEEMKLADWQIGLLSGFAFSLLYLTVGLAMARLADQANRVTILTVCAAFWSVMTALCGLSANFIQLCLFRMGVGVGEAGCLPTSHSLISDYFPPTRRSKALAVYGLGYPIGALFGSVIGGVVLDHWGWRAAFYVIGLPGIFIALLTRYVVKEPQRGRLDVGETSDGRHAEPISLREVVLLIWHSPVLRQMIIALTVMTFATSPTSAFLGPYLLRRFPISYTQLGFIVATSMMLGASISTYLGGVIAQRLARRDERWYQWVPAISVASGAPIYVAAFAQSNWVSLAVLMFIAALINAMYLAPSYTVLHNSIPPGGRAKAVVIVGIFMGLIGQGLGALLGGAANDVVAGILFGHGFLASCPGGEAVKGAPAALNAACHSAMVNATQIVLMTTLAMTVWPAWHFYLAGRNMKRHDDPPGDAVKASAG